MPTPTDDHRAAVRAACGRLLERIEKDGSAVPWVNAIVPQADILLVAASAARMLEALEWYVNVGGENSVMLLDDHGARARAALAAPAPAAGEGDATAPS